MNILIVDDHPIVLKGTKSLLNTINEWQIFTEQHSTNVLKVIEQNSIDLCLFDIQMEPISGIELAKMVKNQWPQKMILLYTGHELEDYFQLVLNKEIDGLLSKTSNVDEVITTIQATIQGNVVLPKSFLDFYISKAKAPAILQPKEIQLLQLVALGYTNKAIATEMSVSQRTVENYLSKIFSQLQVESRAEAVSKAKDMNIIS